MKKENRLYNLDIIRILAFFLLVSVHFFLNTGFYTTTPTGIRFDIAVIFRNLSMSCIPLFLIITGYLHCDKEYNKKYYNSLIKILIVYVLAMIFNYTFYYLYSSDKYNVFYLIKNILSFKDSAWYINMYIGLFLISPFLNKLYKSLNEKEEKILLGTLMFVVSIPTIINSFNFMTGGKLISPASAIEYDMLLPDWWKNLYPVLYYFAGCYIKKNNTKIKHNLLYIFVWLLVFSLFDILRSTTAFNAGDWNSWGGLAVFINTVLIFIFIKNIKFNINKKFVQKALIEISNLTFAAYLVSPVFERVLYYRINILPTFASRFIYYPICVFIIAGCSLITSYIIKHIYNLINRKNPIIKYVAVILLIIIVPTTSIVVKENYQKNHFVKYINNPVVGNTETGTLFDPFCLKVDDEYYLYVSKRNEGSIVLYKSEDGINYDDNYITILKPDTDDFIYNRATVLKHNDIYYLYYTKQFGYDEKYGYKYSEIYVTTSTDGINFNSEKKLVLKAEKDYEKYSVMNPNVIYDEKDNLFKMYYAAGELVEPDVICLATSEDGINFTRIDNNPILEKSSNRFTYDYYKVGAVDVHVSDKYYMFYIGYTTLDKARILFATSEDGITWKKKNTKYIVSPTIGNFDSDATYKPSAVYDEANKRWLLYYNGRTSSNEYIGLAILERENLE